MKTRSQNPHSPVAASPTLQAALRPGPVPRRVACAALLLALALGPSLSRAATITLKSSDAIGTSSFTGATNWSDNAVPSAGNDYSALTFHVRTPTGAGPVPAFAGDSLTLPTATVDSIVLKGDSGVTITVNNLILAGGSVANGGGSVSATMATLAGNINVTAGSRFNPTTGGRIINVAAAITNGVSPITNQNPGIVILAGDNSGFSGRMVVNTGCTLQIDSQVRLGGNPASFAADQLLLDNGTLQVINSSFALDDSNRGITLGASGGRFDLATNVTLTLPNAIAGSGVLSKRNPGTLVLSGNNSFTNTLNIDTGSPSANDGAVRITRSGAVSNASLISIRNNTGTGASSTLQLDGTTGNLSLPQNLAASCRNNAVATIQNLAGTNTLSGFIALYAGGTVFNLQSDAGLLILSGTNQYVGSLTAGRGYVFLGAGDHLVSGPILNSTNGAPINLMKSGTGRLTLAAPNTYGGSTTISNGILSFAEVAAVSSNTTVRLFTSQGNLNLNYAGTAEVQGLSIDGVAQPNGVYGAHNVSAISGTGFIRVTGSFDYADYTIPIHTGLNLIAHQFDHGSNTCDEIFNSGNLGTNAQDGLVLYKYNNSSGTWTISEYSAALGAWTPGDVTLNPGEGAFLQSPASFNMVLSGRPHVPQLPLPVTNFVGSVHLLSRQTNDIGTYDNIMGFPPTNGATVYKWSGSNYTMFSFTSGAWSPSAPTAAVGEAVWISVSASNAPAPPQIACASNKTVVCGTSWTFDPPTVVGSCSGTNVTVSVLITVTNGLCPKVITRTWRATDLCGNTNTCSQTVTVVDTAPPMINCADNKILRCGSAWDFDAPTAYDMCCGSNLTIIVLNTVTNGGPCPATFSRNWRVTDCCSNSDTCSQTVTLVDADLPLISQQPQSLTVVEGTSATFTVTASGTAPLTYQWSHYGVSIAGATGPTLALVNVALADQGVYSVSISNAAGTVTSDSAMMLVSQLQPPDAPVLICPTNATIYTSCLRGVPVDYTVAFVNPPQTNVQLVCFPPSGTIFELGTTIVTCWAWGVNQITNTCSFTITVLLSPPSTNDAGQIVIYAPGAEGSTNNVGLDSSLYHVIGSTNIGEWFYDAQGILSGTAHLLLTPTNVPGLLFGDEADGPQNSTTVSIVPRQDGWDVTLLKQPAGQAPLLAEGDPILATPGDALELLYVPLSAPGLVGAMVAGDSGIPIQEAGQFSLTKTGVGTYQLMLPEKNLSGGRLVLNATGPGGFATNGMPLGVLISQQQAADSFLIQTRIASPGNNGLDTNATLCDADFAFAWVDFVDPSARTNPLASTPSALSIETTGNGSNLLTWADSATGYQLEQSSSLASNSWLPVTDPPTHVGNLFHKAMPMSQAAEYYQLYQKTAQAECNNGDLESGDLTGFNPYFAVMGQSQSLDKVPWSSGASLCTIMTGTAYDPQVGNNILPIVRQGLHSVRLNDANALDGSKSKLDYTFTVTSQNRLFTYSYAVVLQNGHTGDPKSQPRFEYSIYRKGRDYWPWKIKRVTMHYDSGGFIQKGDLYYRNWVCERVDLGDYVGQEVTISFRVQDCGGKQHFGYAYIDGLCQPTDDTLSVEFNMPNSICRSQTITADGSASSPAPSYFWSIQESDQWWGRYGAEFSTWSPHSSVNLNDLYSFKCNTYYRIKLALTNGCAGWKDTTHLLYVKCADVDAGPDKYLCSNGSSVRQVTLGTPAKVGITYEWTPTGGLNNPNVAQPIATITDPHSGCYRTTKYTLTAHDLQGCAASDDVFIYLLYPLTVTIYDSGRDHTCERKHTLTAKNSCAGFDFPPHTTYLWSPGGDTNRAITVIPSPTATKNYAVTVTTPCGSYPASYVLPADPAVSLGPIVRSRYVGPTAIRIGDPLPGNAHFDLIDTESDLYAAASYNAYYWRFEVYNRWGNAIFVDEGYGDGFVNDRIPYWDGKINQQVIFPWFSFRPSYYVGDFVGTGVYPVQMFLRNCISTEDVLVFKGNLNVFR